MTNISNWKKPLAEIYPNMTTEQEKALRSFLTTVYKMETARFINAQPNDTGKIKELALTTKLDAFRQGVEDAPSWHTKLLEKLFTKAKEQGCNSVFNLFAEHIAHLFDTKVGAKSSGDEEMAEWADQLTGDDAEYIRAFPGLATDRDFLAEIIKRRTSSSELAIRQRQSELPGNRKKKTRGSDWN